MTDIIPHYFKMDLFLQFIRCSELALFWIHLFNAFTSNYIYERNKSLFLVICFIFNGYFNQYLKNYISRPLFKYFNDYIPILGIDSRPEGAVDCGYFSSCPNVKSSSFGFPSGHSQFAGLYSGFMIREILADSPNYSYNSLPAVKKLNVFLYLSYVIIMMFSRIYVQGCHTLGQTIFGALIGLILGFFFNKIYKNYIIRYENKFKRITNYLDNPKSKALLIISVIIMVMSAR